TTPSYTLSVKAHDGLHDSNTGTVTVNLSPLTVTSPVVNEASPFAVFNVEGQSGQGLTLSVASGNATRVTDYDDSIEVSSDGGNSWSAYGSGPVALTANNGTLLVRIPIHNDIVYEGPETFSLIVTAAGGASRIGVATINDEAGGTIFRPDASVDISTPRDDDRDVDGIEQVVEEALATLVAALGSSPNARPGDLNGDGIIDGEQNAVTILAWTTVDKFEAAVNRTLVDTKPIISVIVTRPDGAVEDTAQLSNVRVLNPTDSTVGGSRPVGPNLSTIWDPIQFSISPQNAAVSLRDSDASRVGTQTEVVIDVSRNGVTTADFNGYMKYVAQDVLDAYAAQGKTLVDLDGKALTAPGWYDFTQRTAGGDGASFVTDPSGKITSIKLIFTDNAFGDSDVTLNRIADPGVPVLFKASTTPTPGITWKGTNRKDAYQGSSGDDVMSGLCGNDVLYGESGNDTLNGGIGSDILYGGSDADLLNGGKGVDRLFGGEGTDTLKGGGGLDYYHFRGLLGSTDLLAGQSDTISDNGRSWLVFNANALGSMTVAGQNLLSATHNLEIGSVIDSSNSVAVSDGVLRIDLNQDGVFVAAQDYQINLVGSQDLDYIAKSDMFSLR
ncbi:MAG: calcium-binding protein, partial [Methylococcaceae bacterium]